MSTETTPRPTEATAVHYLTFGSGHTRTLGGVRVDPDGVVRVETTPDENPRALVFDVFGVRWSDLYDADTMVWHSEGGWEYYPRGVVATLSRGADGFPVLTATVPWVMP